MKEGNRSYVFHFRRMYASHLATAVLAIILSCSSLPAQFIVQPVNLSYLAQRADVIVQGQVTEVRHESLPGYPNIPTVVVTLDVESMLRGTAGKTYTFREVLIGLRSKEGKQSYKVGQKLILFLPSPSQYGLSSPVGLEQGRFHVAYDSNGSAMVANERSNIGLFKGVEQSAKNAGMRLTTIQSRIATIERGPVALDGFVSLVKGLTSLPRIQ